MSEISPIQETSFDEFSIQSQANQSAGDKIGKVALITFSCIAACAFIPAVFKRKRTFTPTLGNSTPPIVVDTPSPIEQPPGSQSTLERAPFTNTDKQGKLVWMFNTIASTWGVFSLGNIKELKRMETYLNDLHPFEFLRLAPKDKVRSIFQSRISLKTDEVMRGITKGMVREKRAKNLERYIECFAMDMGKEAAPIRQSIEADNWDGLVRYLYDI